MGSHFYLNIGNFLQMSFFRDGGARPDPASPPPNLLSHRVGARAGAPPDQGVAAGLFGAEVELHQVLEPAAGGGGGGFKKEERRRCLKTNTKQVFSVWSYRKVVTGQVPLPVFHPPPKTLRKGHLK